MKRSLATLAIAASACSHGPVRLHGEDPRLLILEAPRPLCGRTATLLFALFDTRIAFREGDPCIEGKTAYRVVDLEPDDWRWLRDRIDFNPLLTNAPAEVDYCPKCLGGRDLFLALRGEGGRLGGMRLRNACSGNPMAAEFPRPEQRYGAQAAEALVCSVDRLVDEMPARFPETRLKPWPKDEPVVTGER